MKKDNKLHIKFHNPNGDEETAKLLAKLIASATIEKYLNNTFKVCADSAKTRHS